MRRAIVPLLAVSTACSLLTSFDGFDEPRASVSDAGDEAGGDAAPPSGPCSHKRWPGPPNGGAPGDLGEVVVAVRSFGLASSNPEVAPYGFDLDNLCTCAEPIACVGSQAGKPCDPADSGIDNATTALVNLFTLFTDAGLDESGLKSGLATGHFGIVFKIGGWNGEPDDPEVRVTLFNAVDVNPGTDGGARFDGNDRWVLDQASSFNAIPAFFSRSAYVSGGVLVADLARFVAKIRIPTVNDQWLLIPVEMLNARIVASIRRVAGGAELRGGEIGGRVPAGSLLALASGAGVCAGTDAYRSLKTVICDARDIPKDPAFDGRDTPCDSLSVGMGFEAIPAVATPDAGTVNDPTPCGDSAPPDDCR